MARTRKGFRRTSRFISSAPIKWGALQSKVKMVPWLCYWPGRAKLSGLHSLKRKSRQKVRYSILYLIGKHWLLTCNQPPGSLDLKFTPREPKGTLTLTADGSQIKRQLTFIPSPATEIPLEVAVPVVVIYHDAATLKQPNLTFTGAVVKDGAPMIYVTFSSGVEVRGRIPTEEIQDWDSKIWPGSLEGNAP